MKNCFECNQNKELTEFNKNSRYSDGYNHICKSCVSTRYYQKHKKKYSEYSAVRMNRLKHEFREFKSTLSCSICNESRWWCLDFHHTDPKQKDKNVATLLARGVAEETIKKEIAKCIVVCKNCHADIHYNLRQSTVNLVL